MSTNQYQPKLDNQAIVRDEDIRALTELLIRGLQGIETIAQQAEIAGSRDEAINAFIHRALGATTGDSLSTDPLYTLFLQAGDMALRSMKLLNTLNTECYGQPEPTEVFTGVSNRPAILISGHDLRDIEDLLAQTQGTDIDVYTHGEMLPAHAYPSFKGFDQFIGNYGSTLRNQREEFESFNGPVILNTSCKIQPAGSYADRLFTTGSAVFPGIKHVPDRIGDAPKDFSEVIEKAKSCDPPRELETGTLTIGAANETLMCTTKSVVRALLLGDIARLIIITGCDGSLADRSFYAELVRKFPSNTVFLTAGCTKYHFNKLELGEIDDIPRVLDAGQCSDSYSLILEVLDIAELMGTDSLNDLPVSFYFTGREKKSMAVLLALLHLGVKGIRFGPTLPSFLTANVGRLLEERFGIQFIDSVEEELEAFHRG